MFREQGNNCELPALGNSGMLCVPGGSLRRAKTARRHIIGQSVDARCRCGLRTRGDRSHNLKEHPLANTNPDESATYGKIITPWSVSGLS
jgi:hypothetical protein